MAHVNAERLDTIIRRSAQRTGGLNLSQQGLSHVPSEVFDLTGLKQLRLDGNQLTSLPGEICQLTNLRSLRLDGNQLTSLPGEICQLTNLRSLRLDGNRLTSLPAGIGYLTNLQGLQLNGNQLSFLLAEIGRLVSLEGLQLDDNDLTVLPPEIGQLTALRRLQLCNNRLIELPPEIGGLRMLRELRLDDNGLTALPSEIGRLTELRELQLHGNQLTALPPEIGQLTALKELRLNGHRLTVVPSEIGHLTSLQELRLDGNQLTTLPSEIGQLISLQRLRLDDNQLTTLPSEIGQLISLQRLRLDDNQLTTLPSEIGQLARLRELRLDNNLLVSLPKELAFLPDETSIEFARNPLAGTFAETAQRDERALRAYLFSLNDGIELYEAKVLLVGEGGVGKTSLVAALHDEPFVEGRDGTHGIEVRPLELRHPEIDALLTLHTWDFGGQELYRITHQFFFSPRAIYLVVWSAREGREQNEVEGWLRRIQLRVPREARVLIVATYCENQRPELDYPHLQSLFAGMLVGRHEIDNRTGKGIAELRHTLAENAAHLPQMGQLFSQRWLDASDEISALSENEPYIAFSQFDAICKRHKIEHRDIDAFAALLHDLGQVIYFAEDGGLNDIVVLDPEWLTKAVSYVLQDPVTGKEGGVLNHARLGKIFGSRSAAATYPFRCHRYLLRLMEKFDISYRIPSDEHHSLVAQLVPFERPLLPWDIDDVPTTGIRVLTLVCEFRETPPGLMAWLTVRHHAASTGMHWRGGVFLKHPITVASEALLELRSPTLLIIEVRAPSPDFYFNVIRDSVETLIADRWQGLDYEFYVPCPTRRDDGTTCPDRFLLEGLLSYREEGGSKYHCLRCQTEHDVSRLLTGFESQNESFQPKLEEMSRKLSEVGDTVDRLEYRLADTAGSMRALLRMASIEISDCPRLFTLTLAPQSLMDRLKLYQRNYRLVLWCEHPGHWHPWSKAEYSVARIKDWMIRIGPYAVWMLKALKLVVPLAASAGELMMTPEQLKQSEKEIELMEALISEFPTGTIEIQQEPDLFITDGELARLDGAVLRAFRMFMRERDPYRFFGGMRRVRTVTGDYLWICPEHFYEYDPGLPIMPDQET